MPRKKNSETPKTSINNTSKGEIVTEKAQEQSLGQNLQETINDSDNMYDYERKLQDLKRNEESLAKREAELKQLLSKTYLAKRDAPKMISDSDTSEEPKKIYKRKINSGNKIK